MPACPALAGQLTSLFSAVSCPSVWIQILPSVSIPHFRGFGVHRGVWPFFTCDQGRVL